jgi:hypothetical protein
MHMSCHRKPSLLALSILLVFPSASALAQVGRGVGGIGGRPAIGGARPSVGGARGLSSPRSGLGIRSNPIVNPAPSLTPNQVLNPRGSLSSGQVLNPSPSLRRPRSGGPTTAAPQAMRAAPQTVPSWGSARRSPRPSTGYSTASHFDQLTAELGNYKNGESWAKYLALPKELHSGEMTEAASDQAKKLLKRFDKLSGDPTYAKVTALPAFWLAHHSLKLKVDPTGKLSTSSSAAAHDGDRTALEFGDTVPTHRTAGEWILQSVVALDAQIAKVAPDGDWQERLSLDDLRLAVPMLSEQPAGDGERKSLDRILETYQAVAKNDQDAVVNELPQFKETLAALQGYLSPLDARQRQDVSRTFDQLGDQLREYKNGESWAKYLAPPKELLKGDKTKGTSGATIKLLKRFDRLRSDPTYGKVRALVAFRPAYEALKRAADQNDTSPAPSAVAAVDNKPIANGGAIAVADKKPIAATDKQPSVDEQSAESVVKKPVPDKKPVADKQPVENEQPIAATDTTPAAPMHQAVGERVLKSVMALEKVAPDKGWARRLSLVDLEVSVSMTSDQPASDSDRKSLAEILETYQAIAKSEDDAVVNQLPEFKETLQALQEYLKPQPPKD